MTSNSHDRNCYNYIGGMSSKGDGVEMEPTFVIYILTLAFIGDSSHTCTSPKKKVSRFRPSYGGFDSTWL